MQNSKFNYSKLTRALAVFLIFVVYVFLPVVTSLAQRRTKQTAPKVTSISTRKTGNGEIVSLSADAALNGVQTWQDPNGTFHLIVPNSGDSPVKSAPGVKVRRVGNSLEIEVQAKRGSNVTVQPRFNRLDLVVNGDIDTSQSATDDVAAVKESSSASREETSQSANASPQRAPREMRSATTVTPFSPLPSTQPLPSYSSQTSSAPLNYSVANTQPASSEQASNGNAANPAAQQAQAADAATEVPVEEGGISSYLFSSYSVTAILIAGLVGLVLWRRQDKSGWEDVDSNGAATIATANANPEMVNSIMGDRRKGTRRKDGRKDGRRSTDLKASKPVALELIEPHEHTLEPRAATVATGPAALFGAYRVDQEVGKLVLGQPHRMDVLASRAADDRRAMEASLLKALRSPDTDEDGRRKARQALEEYGFLARQSATLLLAQDPCERSAAARLLGEVGATTSLQFLLEALYDSEAIVRTQAVESIGTLKLPSAIGALLDIARKYPDMPSSVLSSALNACSIDSLDFFDSPQSEPALLSYGGVGEHFTGEISHLEPSARVYDLPDSTEDEALVDTLAHLQSGDAEARSTAAQTLSIYRVKRSVSALKTIAANDPEPAVRAAAVSSLGAIDHESVFASVLVGLADEARDVRASAARSLSRLSFDRAEAYVRVIETADAVELRDVAQACIKTGMAAQALDRLTSDDRRQAYEAFSLLSLLAKANEAQLILEAIERDAEINHRLVAVQVLGNSGQPEIAPQLRHLAVREEMPEQVRTALMEAVYKIDQLQPV